MNLPQLGDASALILSPAQEQILGKVFMNTIARQMSLVHNSLCLSYLRQLGARLTTQAHSRGQIFHFFIVNNPSINAFAGPGGYIGVYRGLIENTDSESELAAVLAHEIAHVTQRHIARGMAHARAQRLPLLAGTLAAALLGISGHGNAANATLISTLATAGSGRLSFSRSEEKEADAIGLQIMYRAHYDPHAMNRFLKKMKNLNQDYENHPFNLSNHPAIIDRLAETENIANTMATQKTTPSSLRYYLFKAQLNNLNRHIKPGSNPRWLTQAKKRAKQIKNNKYHLTAIKKLKAQNKTQENINLARDYNDALILEHAGYLQSAQIICNYLCSIMQHQVAFLLLKAEVLYKQNKKQQSFAILQQLYHAYPDYPPVTLNYVHTLMDNTQLQKAIDISGQQILHNHQQAIWYNLLSIIYNHKKDYNQATLYHAQACLLQARPQRVLAQMRQLLHNKKLSNEQRGEAKALIERSKKLAHYIKVMLPKGALK